MLLLQLVASDDEVRSGACLLGVLEAKSFIPLHGCKTRKHFYFHFNFNLPLKIRIAFLNYWRKDVA